MATDSTFKIAFESLDVPVRRCVSLDMPVPFTPNLEQQFLPVERLKEKVMELVSY